MRKTFTFAVLHFTIAFTLAYVVTGDVIIGSLVAMFEPMVNTVAFYFHEKVWQTKKLVRTALLSPAKKTMSFAVLHFSVAFTVVYLLTGDAFLGGLLAALEPTVNTVVFHCHERLWQRQQKLQTSLHDHHQDLTQHSKDISDTQVEPKRFA